jgi:predicted nucleotidyltransferase
LKLNRAERRKKVAREAANLIYLGIEKEFRQAKIKAANALNVKFLPANIEVAMEIDKIADENEGQTRQERLVKMRQEALKVMKLLEKHNPILVGSVWRGTIHRESDIDIVVFQDKPENVLRALEKSDLKIMQTQTVTITEKGRKRVSFHVFLESPTKEKFEVIIRSLEERFKKEKCDIYGDAVTGLDLKELKRLLRESPTKGFVPF